MNRSAFRAGHPPWSRPRLPEDATPARRVADAVEGLRYLEAWCEFTGAPARIGRDEIEMTARLLGLPADEVRAAWEAQEQPYSMDLFGAVGAGATT